MVLGRIAGFFRRDQAADIGNFRTLFERFQQILTGNNRILEIISELEDKLSGEYIFGINYLEVTTDNLSEEVHRIISNLNIITENGFPPGRHPGRVE